MQTEMTIACKEWMKVAKDWRLSGGAGIWRKGVRGQAEGLLLRD